MSVAERRGYSPRIVHRFDRRLPTNGQTRLTNQCILRPLHHGIRRTVKRTLPHYPSGHPSGLSFDRRQRPSTKQQPSTTAFISHRSIIVGLSIDSNSTRTENGWNSEGESGRAYVFRPGQNPRSTQFPPESADEGTSDLSGASPFTYLGRITTEARGSGLGSRTTTLAATLV